MIGLNRENQIFNTIWGNFTSVWWGFYLDGSEYEFIIEEPTNKPSMLTVCFTSL